MTRVRYSNKKFKKKNAPSQIISTQYGTSNARSAKPTDYAIFCNIVVYHVHFHQGNPQDGDAMN